MAQRNVARDRQAQVRTHEGGRAQTGNFAQQLKRAVTACMLWEDTFYESGKDIATRIHDLAKRCDPDFVAQLALDVRKRHGLRHAPLWLILSLLPRDDILGKAKSTAITDLVSRADEIPELLAMYWDGKGEGKPVAAALKRGLAGAFHKFDEYQFAKYNRDKAVTMRDAMFICHPKPKNDEQAALFKRLANDELKTPDTWEVGLSAGGDKKEVFTDLLIGLNNDLAGKWVLNVLQSDPAEHSIPKGLYDLTPLHKRRYFDPVQGTTVLFADDRVKPHTSIALNFCSKISHLFWSFSCGAFST